MGHFDALTLALEEWFETPLCDLPEAMRERVAKEFLLQMWDELSPDQRRHVALQLDDQNDPATEQDQQFWFDFIERRDGLNAQKAEWELVTTPTASDKALKESRVKEIKKEIASVDAQEHLARGDYFPERRPNANVGDALAKGPSVAPRYLAYPKAMHQLRERLGATPEELAAWVFIGPKDGGIAAFVNANELESPPRFSYSYFVGKSNYIAPLMGCWFKADDVDQFEPIDRYIVGAALIQRWSNRPGLHPAAFVHAKIAESRLLDIHPIYGGTQGTFSERPDWPSLESGLFSLAHIMQIEAEDFEASIEPDALPRADDIAANLQPEITVGSPEWRKQTAISAANALHDKPGGSRDKKRQIREIWASGKYTSRDLCAEQECAALNMSISVARRALYKTPEPSRC